MRKLLLAVTVLSASAIGCVEGGSYNPEALGGDGDDDLGTAQQALGEPDCGTVAMSGLFWQSADGISRSTLGTQTSPDWTYTSGACPYQYIVEYTNLPAGDGTRNLYINTTFQGGNVWSDITNETDCERMHLLVGTYIWNSNTTDPSSTETAVTDGLWTGTSCVGVWSNSSIGVGADYGNLSSTPLDGKYKVRVAARAYQCAHADNCDDWLRTSLRVETTPIWLNVIN
ncbi:hypothetical protein [Sorangium sp. So ce128]|uniref:hypothetical protein n=1 Tax=Sorangium sp. So ce128 TaxID=3133281 RepID=UPI003F63A80D